MSLIDSDTSDLVDRLATQGFLLRRSGETLSLINLANRPLPETLRGEIGSRRDSIMLHLADRMWPLSFNQQRMWFLDRLQNGHSTAYNVPLATDIRGPLDVAALEQALTMLVARHAILRTTIIEHDGEPAQRILAPGPIHLEIEAIADGDLQARLNAESGRPFDLTAGPCWRASLFVLTHDHHVLLINQHHIINDGWSLVILQRDLAALYDAALHGRPSDLPDTPLQFAEFALWQRRTLPKVIETALDHWQRRLAGFTPFDLPADRPRPPRLSGEGRTHRFAVPTQLAEALSSAAIDRSATSCAGWLAVFVLLLSRWSGQDDIVVGMPFANRRDAAVADLIGYVANTLPLRVDLSGNPTFASLMSRVASELLDADAHQEAPFDLIVNRMAVPRDPSRNPIFQVAFVYQTFADGLTNLRLPGLVCETSFIDTGTAKFDLTLTLTEAPEGLAAEIEYSTDLFDPATIERLTEQLLHLADTAVRTSTIPLDRLDVLPPAQRAGLLAFGCVAGTVAPDGTTFVDLFARSVASCADLPAVIGDETLTYAELDRRSSALAHSLRTRIEASGVPVADAVIGVAVPKSVELVVAFVAVLKAGGAYLALAPDLPADRLRFMVQDSAPRLIIVTAQTADVFGGTPVPRVFIDSPCGELNEAASDSRPGPQDLAYVIYTSGTTGRPKGALIEHAALSNLVQAQRELFRLEAGHRVMLYVAMSFDVSIGATATALAAGAALHLVPQRLMAEPEALGAMIRDHAIDLIELPATIARQLPQRADMAPRTLVIGGEVCPQDVLSYWRRQCRVINAYGPSEATVLATADEVHEPIVPNLIGRPIANVLIRVLDRASGLCPIGVPGEICIGGAGLARGYLGQPELTARQFIADPAGRGRLYRSGDIGRWRPDGRIEWLGRVDEQIKLNGLRIEPGEIARVMEQHPGVNAAHVLVHQDGRQSRLVGYYASAPDVDERALRQELRERLPAYMVPSLLVRLDALPAGPNGKLDPRALPPPQADVAQEGRTPRTPLESTLADIWCKVLRLPRIGIDDEFFALGGDSIMTIQVCAAARATGIALTAQAMFENPTIARLAEVISRAPAALVVSSPDDAAPGPATDVPDDVLDALWRVGPVEAVYGLSPLQEGLLFHALYAPGSDQYCVQLSWLHRGRLDSAALKRAWEGIVARHGVLRTAFVWEGVARPLQAVYATAPLDWEEADWCGESDARLRDFLADDRRRGFALEQPGLMRLRLMRLGDDSWAMVWTTHHLLMDGWCLPLILQEVALRYRQACGEAIDLPPAPPPFERHIAWLARQDRDLAQTFWRQHLAGIEAPTPLAINHRPLDVRRPIERLEQIRLVLDQSRSAALAAFARRHRVTLNTLIELAWASVLSRYSGQDDVVFGIAVSGRPPELPQVEQMIGLFINTVPLRLALDHDSSVLDNLQSVLTATHHVERHATVGLATIQGWSELEAGSALFQSLLVFESYPGELPAEVAELRIDEKTNYPLTLAVLPGTSTELRLLYDADSFDTEAIARLSEHLDRALAWLIAHAERPLGDLEFLSAAERHDLLVAWNDRWVPYPCDATLHGLFADVAQRHPSLTAVVEGNRRLDFAALDRAANWLAHRIVAVHAPSTGSPAGRPIALCCGRTIEMVVAILAILKAGGAWVPLDPDYPAERLSFMLEDSGADLVLASPQAAHDLTVLQSPRLQLLIIEAMDGAGDEHPPIAGAGPTDPAYVIYTSGSTGRPKGVACMHRAVINFCHEWQNKRTIAPGDGGTLTSSLSFDVTVYEIFSNLLFGAAVHLLDKDTILDADRFARYLRDQRIQNCYLPPHLLNAVTPLIESDGVNYCLKRLMVGVEPPLERAMWRIKQAVPGIAVVNGYGTTETTIGSIAYYVERDTGRTGNAPIGVPFQNQTAYLLDKRLRPVPLGAIGEIYIGGEGVSNGYLNRPELTIERFIDNPFQSLPDRLAGRNGRIYRTGDLGRMLPDGQLECLGRIDTQVKIRGYRVEPGEIEAVIASCAGVTQSAVIVVNSGAARRLVGYYAAPSGGPSEQEVRAQLAGVLPSYMVPAVLVRLDRLKLSPNGKIDRKALPLPEIAAHDGRDLSGPRDDTEATLAQVWSAVLKLDHVGIDEDFFALGGDSILTIQVIALARQMGLELTASQLFAAPTIRALAAGLKHDAAQPRAIVEEPEVDPRRTPLAPIQQWFFEVGHAELNHWNQAFLFHVEADVSTARLRDALSALADLHPVFASRFQDIPGEGWRETTGEAAWPVEEFDLSTSADPSAALRNEADRVQASLDIDRGPLARATVFIGHPDGQRRLLLAIHHLVVDGVSWRILIEDLDRLLTGDIPTKPAAQFAAWRSALVRYARTIAAGQWDYWLGVGAAASTLPLDGGADPGCVADADRVAFTLDTAATGQLLTRAGAAYRTQINDLMLAALALAVRASTGLGDVVVDLEGHGREECVGALDVSRTVGWFTSMFPVHLRLPDDRDIGAAIKAVKEILRAVPDKGIGYGALRFLADDPRAATLAARACARIGFNYLGRFDALRGRVVRLSDEQAGAAVSPRNRLIHPIEISAYVADGALKVIVEFSRMCCARTTAEHLTAAFETALGEIVAHCLTGSGGITPSDCPLAPEVSQATLDALWRAGRVEAVYGLSPLQEGLLFHALYAPGSDQYCVQLSWRHEGRLDTAALRRAWDGLVARHGILRTAFVWEGVARPLQAVYATVPLNWEEADWRGESADRLEAFLAEDRRRGFALDQPGLMRLRLIRLGDDSWAMVWTTHHLLMDGWCLPLILQEVALRYRQACGETIDLPAAPPPFERHIAWLARQDRGAAHAFWRAHLAGIEAPTPLAINHRLLDIRRPIEQLERRRLVLERARSASLAAFARQHRVTLNTLIELAWASVLARYSGQDDIVFGIAVSGRPPDLPQVERMIGLFINTVPLRLVLDQDRSVLENLHAVQAATRNVIHHGHLSLTEIQRQSAVPNGTPLFHALIVFENYPDDGIGQAPGGGYLDMRGDIKTSFPLALVIVPAAELLVQASYDAACFDHRVIERMLGHLSETLGWLAAHPERPLADAALLTQAERRAAFADAITAAPYPRDRSLADLFEAVVPQRRQAQAVMHDAASISFCELNARANRLAHRLQRLGVGAETAVGISIERSIPLIVGLMGILKAGGAYVPLEPDVPDERLAFMLADSQAPVLVTTAALAAKFPHYPGQVIAIDDAALDSEPSSDPVRAPAADPLLYIAYTSGSTGRPKGVMVQQSAVLNRFHWLWRTLPLADDEVGSQISSINFVDAVWEIFSRLACGIPFVVLSDEVVRDPLRMAGELARHRVTRLEPVPSLLASLLDNLPAIAERLPHLRYCICSGEILPVELARRFRATMPSVRLFNRYGSTEATSVLWQEVLTTETFGANVPVGRPVQNVGICILDGRRRPLPHGIAGSLYVYGDAVARGYHGRPDLTAERFVTLALPDREVIAYYTGDLARHRPDGSIEVLGRDDNQLSIHGYRIEPGEIETALGRLTGIRDCVAVVRDVGGSRQLVAFYVEAPDTGAALTPQTLRSQLAAHLPSYMVPSLFVKLPALPLTINGKVDRKSLVARDLDPGHVRGDVLLPRDAIERQLYELWAKVIGIEHFGIDDDFFAVGGHSLLAVRLAARINALFHRSFPVAWIFSTRTIADQATALRKEGVGADFEPTVMLKRGDRTLFLIHPGHAGAEAYSALVPRLAENIGLCAVESWNLYGDGPDVTDIPTLARRYLAAIRAVQPAGPYLLGGWSFGGTVAYEISCQLAAAGETVAHLFLLDSFGAHEGRRAWLADFDAAGRAAFLDVPFYRDMPDVTRRRMERVISLENAMLAAFRPKRYDGPVLLLKASQPEAPPPHRQGDYPPGFLQMLQATQAQADNYWAGTATHLTVRLVAGTHGALMSGTALVEIAEALSQTGVPSTTEDSSIMGSATMGSAP
ncbi:non-ribosomal peptide synthase [Bradyrhizobium oligotrophicum S58]|uniref:Non-ribosomal peptide synthase n=1 Tax=Bradyrhizobium oligotrophicum S58 TaxID=1245469 RepID=M4Z447_9BRAD|nr:non-ribosomal peptide synthetase [Bradyrhizobium oligotrophicum]BAM88163.1 non-ribosomal peptide synthase [Bradyrhizobium oligotrophicum S58]